MDSAGDERAVLRVLSSALRVETGSLPNIRVSGVTGRSGIKTEVHLFYFKKLTEPEANLDLRMSHGIRSWIQCLCLEALETGETKIFPATCSQERSEDILVQGICGKLQRGDVCDSSGKTAKRC